MNWYVYIILCSDASLYTGITTDIARRMGQHAAGRGAKYFRGRQPDRLVYLESGHNRSTATKRELSIKGMKIAEKSLLISSFRGEFKPMEGQNRKDIHPGLAVSIILKKDQRTGKLTDGIVKDILTSSPFHSRGIKVRLEDGRIGRVHAFTTGKVRSL